MKKIRIPPLLLTLSLFAGCTGQPQEQMGPWDSKYYVPNIPGTNGDFMRGM